MLYFSPQVRIFLASKPVDFRRGIDGLGGICRSVLKQDPLDGAVFVFVNKKRNSIKILAYDGQGFWLCTKRLSAGRFKNWPEKKNVSNCELLTLIWNGNPETASFATPWRKLQN